MSRNREKPCKIYILGAHAQGKSTLARHIATTYRLPLFDEIARIEIAKLGSMNFDALRTNLDAVTQFQRNVFAAQLRVGAGVARFVSDRAFDNLAYAAENAATGTAGKLWRSAGCRRYVRGIKEDVRLGRGAVFFVRSGLVGEADGTRATRDLDAAAIHRIDGMVKLLLDLGEVRAVHIQTTNFQERCTIVDAVMRRLV